MFDKKIIEEQLNISLKKLNTDYIDLLSLHHVNISEVNDDNIFFLKKLIKDGKIKNYGFSPINDFDNYLNYNFTHFSYDYILNNIEKISKNKNYLIYSVYGKKNKIDKSNFKKIQNQYKLSYVITMFNKQHILNNINLVGK